MASAPALRFRPWLARTCSKKTKAIGRPGRRRRRRRSAFLLSALCKALQALLSALSLSLGFAAEAATSRAPSSWNSKLRPAFSAQKAAKNTSSKKLFSICSSSSSCEVIAVAVAISGFRLLEDNATMQHQARR